MTTQEAYNTGLDLQNKGRLADAEAIYRQILAYEPNHAETICRLAILAQQVGRTDKGLVMIEKALAVNPDNADFLNIKGFFLYNLGQLDEAEEACRRALQIMPRYPEALNNLGNVLAKKARLDEAEIAYREALSIRPDSFPAYVNLGNLLIERGKARDSLALFQQAIAQGMKDPQILVGLGNALMDLKDFKQAQAAYCMALEIRHDYAEGFNNLGNALWMQDHPPEALAAYAKALELRPNYLHAQRNGLRAYRDLGRIEEAVAGYQAALTQHPDSNILHSEYLFALHFHPDSKPDQLRQEHQRWNDRHAKSPGTETPPHPNDRHPDRKLRIGYVSPDFREHSVAYFIESIFAHHNRDLFEVFCYADLHRPDATSKRLQSLVSQWRNITGMPDAQVAAQIRDDKIDILIDLAGQTANNRLPLFARKPAPVQITYLGYPNTTGLSAMEYRITDPLADPPGQTEIFHTEKLLRLPECFLCFTPSKESPDVSPLPASSKGHVTFGCFNALPKINASQINLWCQILQGVPQSKLLLKTRNLTDPETRDRILEHFKKGGIEPDRIETRGFADSRHEHLNAFNQVDLALDTFPYNGTTVTCESLWMGVPVITLAGQTHVSRVGLSLLNNVGLKEFVATSPQDYVTMAIAHARDLPTLAKTRANLHQKMSQSILTDCKRFTEQLESLYRHAWQSWCER